MPRTRIIDTVVIGGKIGSKSVARPIFTTRRYDILDGNMNYKWSENRTHATVFYDDVPVDLVMVRLDDKHHVTFEPLMVPPSKGDAVRLVEHRIGGGTVYDLYNPRYSMIVGEGEQPFPDPGLTVPIIAAVIGTIGLSWYGHPVPTAAIWAGATGAALFMLSTIHHHYIDKGLRLMRWRTERRLKAADGRKS